jgi:cytochrome c oxidase assembly factor CtaG/polyferredoxin
VNPILAAALGSWSFDPSVVVGLAILATLYLRGTRSLAACHPERFPRWRRAAFLAGLAVFLVAVASPIDAFADLLLQVHMAQHLLLMMVAAPLVWLGAPVNPILHGLPRAFLRSGLGPFLSWPALKRVGAFLVHPITAWLTFTATLWLWHVPALYEAALRDPFWHDVEHLSFFAAALLFWFPVVQPWPSHPVWPRAAMLPYLALAGLQTTVFSAVFAFSERVFYPSYAEMPRLFGIGAIVDQQAAGAVMWVPGSIVLLVAVCGIAVDALDTPIQRARTRRRVPAPRSRPRFDALRVRGLGRLFASRRVRRASQAALFAIAAAIVLDGWFGPDLAGLNLAGVLPWTHWRAFAVIGLLVAGNLVCFACPFTLPRALARRVLGGNHQLPQLLRGKWVAVGLFATFLVAYEVFDLWDSPWWTAWVVVGYFAAAFAIDGFYGRATFCRSVCPIGQFQFTAATISPLEVDVRAPDVCARCTTHDCLVGGAKGPGCDLDLFQPTKVGNLDCTFCLDCVRACPHDNVGIHARLPGRELVSDAPRAGLGRLSRRADLAAFARIFAFGAFVNAVAMVAPVAGWQRALGERAGLSETAVAAFALPLAFLVLPYFATALASHIGAAASGSTLAGEDRRGLERRFVLALIPLGFGMWLAHWCFHLATAGGAWRDIAARYGPTMGAIAQPVRFEIDSLMPLEITALGVGLLVTLFVAWRIALDVAPEWRRAMGHFAPWAVLACGLWAAGLWILFQPMEMRGAAMQTMGMG